MSLRAALALALTAVCLLVAPGGARAAEDAPPSAATGMSVEIEDLDGIVDQSGGAGVMARVTNERSDPVEDVRVRIEVHDRTRSRFALADALDGGAVGESRGAAETRSHDLDPDEQRRMLLRVSAGDLGMERAAAGVYPATISVLDEHGTAYERVTALIVPPNEGEPLRLAVMLRLQGPLATAPSGPHHQPAVATSAERALRLADELRDPLPATVAVDGRTMDELRAVATGERAPPGATELIEEAQDAVRAVVTTTRREDIETVALPYGPADLVALVRTGMTGEARHLVELGKARADELGERGDEGASVVLPARGLDAATADWLSDHSRGAVLDELDLGLPLDRDLPSTPPAVRALSGTPDLPIAVPDPLLDEALGRSGHGGAALAAQRVLAETAAAFFERPSGSTPRGIVLRPSAERVPGLLPAIADQLEQATWLEAVTLTQLLDQVPASGEPESLAYGGERRRAELPAEYVLSVRDARRRLTPLADLLGEEAVAEHTRRLDLASAVQFRGRPLRSRGEAIVSGISDMAEEVRRAVTVVDGPPLTLTGTEGAVPVTLVNEAQHELTVRVRLLTTRYEVEDEAGRDVRLPPGEEITTTFDVRARTPGGTYPLIVEVSAPDGGMRLASGHVTVRSTAASITAIVITGGAALLLVGWAVHALARRRSSIARRSGDGSAETSQEAETAAPGGNR